MESIFKFVLERPPVQLDKDLVIELNQNTNFQAQLATALGKQDPRKELKNASSSFRASTDFVKEVSELPISDALKKFAKNLDDLELKKNITKNDMKDALSDAFGMTAAQLIQDQNYKQSLSNLKDSIICIKYLPEEHNKPIEALSKAVRDLEIIARLHADDSFPGKGDLLRRYRKRTLKLPTKSQLKSILATRESERKKRLEEERKRLERKKESIRRKAQAYKSLKKAIDEIMGLDHDHLEETLQQASRGIAPPKDLQPLNIFREEIDHLHKLGELQILNAKTLIERGLDASRVIKEQDESKQDNVFTILQNKKMFFAGAKKFEPNPAINTRFRFKRGSESLLSRQTQAILTNRKLSITKMGIDKIIGILKQELVELSNELEELTENQQIRSIKRIGNVSVISNIPQVSKWGYNSSIDIFEIFDFELLDNRIPNTKGSVSPAGIADLIIVKQQLKEYRGMDVAHIENILRGEKKVRDHRTLNKTVEETFTETELTKEEQHELESTDRFELSREASETIKTQASFKAGLTVSGSYGPTVKFSANAEGSMSTTKEEAVKTASKFSKEVVQKSVEKISERILQRYKTVVTHEVEEKNNHTLDNTSGTGHISGVYQWVEKVYEAQMFNYGIRMMFDFMIPEPGSYIIEAMQSAHASSLEVKKPINFTLKPNNISDENYNFWVHEYGVKGVVPPPEEYVTKAYNYNAGEGDKSTDFQNSGIITIDDGYVAVQASMGLACTQWSSDRIVDVVIGRRTHRFVDDGNWMWITNLNDETESIPLGFITNDLADIAVGIEVKCKRTGRAYRKWQLDTHAKIMEAYQTSMADYEEQLAALEMQAGVEIEGKNPKLNLEIMKDELKKNCISILTEQHYDLFNSIQNGTNGMPQIDIYQNEAEGAYVRFFEQAFEWEHITWLTYPYFWGRKCKWEERIAYEDPDPLFNQFIKAGYCRAVIPIRPGFEGALDHFLTFGEIWEGGPLPAISNELYLPIADELAERLDKPGDEIPEGDPWDVIVPTNLVKLRDDDNLPTWTKDSEGKWVPST